MKEKDLEFYVFYSFLAGLKGLNDETRRIYRKSRQRNDEGFNSF